MLQTGALMRDVSPRELVAMVVSLYPHALDVDEALELAGVRDVADRRTQELSGGQAQRVRVAIALARIPKCWCSMSRPWAWTWRPGAASGSRCAPSQRAGGPSSSRLTTWMRPTPTPLRGTRSPTAPTWASRIVGSESVTNAAAATQPATTSHLPRTMAVASSSAGPRRCIRMFCPRATRPSAQRSAQTRNGVLPPRGIQPTPQ